ncbi:MAG: DUF456 domain-containing protein [Bacteroidota bacterium]
MRLYVKDRNNANRKIYLSKKAKTRNELALKLGSSFFKIEGQFYSVNEVEAESYINNGIVGSVSGLLAGLAVGGPLGAVIGFVGGTALGTQREGIEQEDIDSFNQSSLLNV